MIVDVSVKTKMQIDIDEKEAFKVLLQTLNMNFVLNEDLPFYIQKNRYDENQVWLYNDVYDDRGDLFIALRNVATNIFPNLSFRGDDYIYNQ